MDTKVKYLTQAVYKNVFIIKVQYNDGSDEYTNYS